MAKTCAELHHENKVLREEVAELQPKTDFRGQLKQRLINMLEPLVDCMEACHKRHKQQEADKALEIELLNKRAPLVGSKVPQQQEELLEITTKLQEARRRMNLFASEITALAEAEKKTRRDFAGC